MQAEGSSAWTNVPYLSTSPQTAGVLELSYRLTGISAERLRVRPVLTGSHGARPHSTNLRAIVKLHCTMALTVVASGTGPWLPLRIQPTPRPSAVTPEKGIE